MRGGMTIVIDRGNGGSGIGAGHAILGGASVVVALQKWELAGNVSPCCLERLYG